MKKTETNEVDELLDGELDPLLYYQAAGEDYPPESLGGLITPPTLWRDPGYKYRALLIVSSILMALLGSIIFAWQICVLSGRINENPDGTLDDWHEQKLYFGIAVANIFSSCPMVIIGASLVFVQENSRIGHFLLIMSSFWFVWTSSAFTITSLRFENPKISFDWFIVFPLGALVGLIYIVWVVANFDKIFVLRGGYESIP
jgi:hypothetical protein